MNKRSVFLLVSFLIAFLISFCSADIISINSGGDDNLVINSNDYNEGFFGCVPTTCTKLGYNCGSWADGCAKFLDCGICAPSYTCTTGVCTFVGGGEGGGGGGGGGGGASPDNDLIIFPKQINFKILNATTRDETIIITNNGTLEKTVIIGQTGLDDMIIFLGGITSITLAPGESKNLIVRFVAPIEDGKTITGKILIGSNHIPVSLNIVSKYLLFDSNIVVLNKDYRVSQGGQLKTKVELIPMGDKERMDVTLNYTIRGYDGKIYLTQSETLLVENKMDFNRNFGTGTLPLGQYIVALDLQYPGGIAPSSAHFEVVIKSASDIFGITIFFLLIGILLIIMLIIILLIRRKSRRKMQNE
jgi:hypothetical protein